ncbi:hypothetical protein LCGC14_2292350 [marine sediment metagenome]|uniref:Uncharacterized protein n=1 Tax=marine sediment metagenome TaxID=412755 RepID=A0A0F9CQX6_9ZZZZ
MGYQSMGMGVTTEERRCRVCHREFAARMATVMGRSFGPTLCEDCAARQEEEVIQDERKRVQDELRQRWVTTCGLHPNYWDATFETWETRRQLESKVEICRAYADSFPVDRIPFRHPSLWLYSAKSGLGKTHMASAVIHRIIGRWDGEPVGARCPVRYETGPSLQLRVRRSYSASRDPDAWQESEADIYDQLRGVPLLVLDDVGDAQKEAATEHSRRVYFHIIDQRYSDGLPVMLCSNVDMTGLERVMGAAVVDRLREMVLVGHEMVADKGYRDIIRDRSIDREGLL